MYWYGHPTCCKFGILLIGDNDTEKSIDRFISTELHPRNIGYVCCFIVMVPTKFQEVFIKHGFHTSPNPIKNANGEEAFFMFKPIRGEQ